VTAPALLVSRSRHPSDSQSARHTAAARRQLSLFRYPILVSYRGPAALRSDAGRPARILCVRAALFAGQKSVT